MKTLSKVSVLAALLAVAPSPCFADWSFGPISKERGKELGMEVRSWATGTNEVTVGLEIIVTGERKMLEGWNLSRVELQIKQGEKQLVSAVLKEYRPKPGQVEVSFTGDRAQLETITLRVWVDQGVGGVIHELRMKDFVDLERVR
jgi:hypothetical protein